MNNEKIDNFPTLEQFKKMVQDKFFNEYKKQGYKLLQVYEIGAKKQGYANWHHMQTTLKNREKQQEEK